MKDKSRFVSSLIISLIAGFSYFILSRGTGERIIQTAYFHSVGAADESEHYFTTNSFPFVNLLRDKVRHSAIRKSFLIIKRSSKLEFREGNDIYSGEQLLSGNEVSYPAEYKAPTPDVSADFSATLEKLMKSGNGPVEVNSGRRYGRSEPKHIPATISSDERAEITGSENSRIDKPTKSFSVGKFSFGFSERRFTYEITSTETSERKISRTEIRTAPECKVSTNPDCTRKREHVRGDRMKAVVIPKGHSTEVRVQVFTPGDEDADSDDGGSTQDYGTDDGSIQ